MTKIYNIKYIEPYYTLLKKMPRVKMTIHECFGYCAKYKDCLIVTFVKYMKSKKKKEILEGLLIPECSLITQSPKIKVIEKVNSKISIRWNDVVYIKNSERKYYSKMYTEGILIQKNKKTIVVKNPETIRIEPKPIQNHPNKKPTYYIIPIQVIEEISLIK